MDSNGWCKVSGSDSKRQILLRAAKDKTFWRAMISHILKGYRPKKFNKAFSNSNLKKQRWNNIMLDISKEAVQTISSQT